MQTMSHKTRAYYHNVQGFPGFVLPSPITVDLTDYLQCQERALESEEQEKSNRKTMIDLIGVLSELKDNKERIDCLGDWYPNLCVYVIQKRGWKRELQKYMEICKNYEEDPVKYTHHIQGYWLPHL